MGVKGSCVTHYLKTCIRIYHELPEHKTASRYVVVSVEGIRLHLVGLDACTYWIV